LTFSDGSAGASGVREVRFADTTNGWLFLPDLWATHDGGVHWSRSQLPSGQAFTRIDDLEATTATVTATFFDEQFVIATSPVSRDAWTTTPTDVSLGAGPVPHADLVVNGNAGWLTNVNRVTQGGARLEQGRWVTWHPPCMGKGGGLTLAASTPTALTAVCSEGTWSDDPQRERLYVSSDGGTNFHVVGESIPIRGGQASVPGAVVGEGFDKTKSQSALLASYDGGHRWQTVYEIPQDSSVWGLRFVTRDQAVAVRVNHYNTANAVLMTRDRGRTWRELVFS
jgi:hypothetical protein